MNIGVLLVGLFVVVVYGQTPPSVCRDTIPNCGAYPDSACRGTYESWARVRCAHRCGFCGSTPASPPPVCKDLLPNCNQYQKDTCFNPLYKKWASDHCRVFCGICTPTGGYVGPTPPIPNVG